jgi:hypothetical protein
MARADIAVVEIRSGQQYRRECQRLSSCSSGCTGATAAFRVRYEDSADSREGEGGGSTIMTNGEDNTTKHNERGMWAQCRPAHEPAGGVFSRSIV